MSDAARLGIRAYARHRKAAGLPGTTPAAVRKALDRGQIGRGADGLIDVAAADRAWPGPEAAPRGEPAGGGGEPDEGVSYGEARRRKEIALARLREYEVAELERETVRVDDVAAMVRGPLEAVAAALKNAPSRHAAALAEAAGTPLPVAQRFLEKVIEGIRADLRTLADRAVREAAAGKGGS